MNYNKFFDCIPNDIKTIIEVGSRDCLDSISLCNYFKESIVHAFECNPKTIDICKNNIKGHSRIIFNDYGLSDTKSSLPFYCYITDNHFGNSSFYKRIDYNTTQINIGNVETDKLENYINNNNLNEIDLLCMDTQGSELNILKGTGKYLSQIKRIILETPKKEINTTYLPENVHSKYIGAPDFDTIHSFLYNNHFIEIKRIQENMIEDNILYVNSC